MGRLSFSTLIKINALSFTCLFIILIFSLLSTTPLTEKRVVIQTINNAGVTVKGKGSLAFQGPANSTDRVKVKLSFPPSNRTGLASRIMAATVPGSKTFGQHPTKAEVASLVAPDPQVTEIINSWLKNNGIPPSSSTSTRNHVQLSLSVDEANQLLRTKLGVFNNTLTGESSINAPNVSVPSALADFAINIQVGRSGNGSLNSTRRPLAGDSADPGDAPAPATGSCSASLITPSCLQTLYEIPSRPTFHPNNSIAIPGFKAPAPIDIETFLTNFRSDLDGSDLSLSVTNVDGNATTEDATDVSDGEEASLDVEWVMALAPTVNTTFYSLSSNTIDGFMDFVQFLLDLEDPPKVVSTSYGFNEADISREAAEMMCDELMQLTALGVSIIFATGDGGVSGGEPQQCSSFQVTFPASCPWVTAVGSTMGLPETEVGANFTNGGTSNYFPMPSYQHVAVRKYLHNLGTTNMGLFNPKGRGTPDVSAEGVNLPFITGGASLTGSGTSFSAPIVAAMVAGVNGALLAAGKSPVGFLNPTLYYQQGVANDITNGSNPGCGTDGFSAAVGWDPVTGVGSLNAARLFTAFAV